MARLLAAKCPNCGAGVRIDPARDFVTCTYCNTSAFVRTQTRPLTQQFAQQYPAVIDLPSPPRLGWVLAAAGTLVVLTGAIAAYTALDARRRTEKISPPEPLARDVPVPYTPAVEDLRRAAEPGREMWGVSRSAQGSSPVAPKPPEGSAPVATTASKDVSVREGRLTVSGRIPASEISGVVRKNFGRFRLCYEQGLARTPSLQGRITVRFVIGRDGGVSNVSHGDSNLGDARVVSCVLSAFYGLSFPPPPGGIVTVAYPLSFARG
jgi:DNA-directed RNA polymerase subunit RPC12/RpoP